MKALLEENLLQKSLFFGLTTRIISKDGKIKKLLDEDLKQKMSKLNLDNFKLDQDKKDSLIDTLKDYITIKNEFFEKFVNNDENEMVSYDEDSCTVIKKAVEDLNLVNEYSQNMFDD